MSLGGIPTSVLLQLFQQQQQQQQGQPDQPAQQMSQQGQFNPADMQSGLPAGPQPFSFAPVQGGIGRNIINALANAGKAATYVAESPRERESEDARAQQLYETKQKMAMAAGEFGQREKDRASQAAALKAWRDAQEQTQNQREDARDARQAALFKQQQSLEDQREGTRQAAATQAQQESEKRQGAQFAEQEKLQGMRDKAADIRASRTADRADTSKREKAITYWQPALDSAERVNVMAKNYEEGVNNHNQQAMLSLLSNHLGMTMGLQKGARLNQALINEAQKSQPWLQGIQAKFDKDGYLSGVTLSPNQMKQMLDLGFDRYREDVKKSRSTAGFIGVTDEPPRQINVEGARYYINAAGGDKDKARAMAKQDGWNF